MKRLFAAVLIALSTSAGADQILGTVTVRIDPNTLTQQQRDDAWISQHIKDISQCVQHRIGCDVVKAGYEHMFDLSYVRVYGSLRQRELRNQTMVDLLGVHSSLIKKGYYLNN